MMTRKLMRTVHAPLLQKVELNEFGSMLQPCAVILDAGCAFGRDTEYLKSKGFNVQGIDLSPAFIRRAKELVPGTDFAVKDVRETGFADEQFDGIWCNATLLHLKDEDMAKALAEFKRILKPGGILAVSLKRGTGTRQFVENFSSKSERFFNFQTHETFLEKLQEAGLQELSWHYLNERERYGQDKRDLDWLYSFARNN
ncbi:MAG TPA: class I SAM-dependent methyltransferase [Candidatus Saccharimonadales bacterium]|nr:class I SAM-dependent methyltransferase [Candidatus Saccharimonadales bacterium]